MEREGDRYVFLVDWFDASASLVRKYTLMFYTQDNAVEMIDMKNRRMFLKRTRVETLSLTDLYLGATLNLLSRQLIVVDYGDDYTRNTLGSRREQTVLIVRSEAFPQMGQLLDAAAAAGMSVLNARMVQLTRANAVELLGREAGSADRVNELSSGPVVAVELMGVNALAQMSQILASFTPQAPSSARAGSFSGRASAVLSSTSASAAAREGQLFFGVPSPFAGTASFKNTTLCLVKPHAMSSGLAGKILAEIYNNGFTITALQTFRLDKTSAEEFLEVYKGVVMEYQHMVTELSAGVCMAIEVGGTEDVQQRFRELCGPVDPDVARHIRQHTLRAHFGSDKVRNAVHCTDLPEDQALEVEYFFNILVK